MRLDFFLQAVIIKYKLKNNDDKTENGVHVAKKEKREKSKTINNNTNYYNHSNVNNGQIQSSVTHGEISENKEGKKLAKVIGIVIPLLVAFIAGAFLLISVVLAARLANKTADEALPTQEAVIIEATENIGTEDLDDVGKTQLGSEVDVYSDPAKIEDELNNGVDFIPDAWDTDWTRNTLALWIFDNISYDTLEEYSVKIVYAIQADVLNGSGKKVPVSEETLFSSLEYCYLTQQANSIEMEANAQSVEEYETLIELRTSAMELISDNPYIAFQLARNYIEYANYRFVYGLDSSEEDKNLTFECGVKAIEMFQYVLTYDVKSSEKGDTLYRIGQAYHILGNIENMDAEKREQLFLLAGVYYKLANEAGTETYVGYDEYYAGMIDHKLGVISGEDNYFYLVKAAEEYEVLCQDLIQNSGSIKWPLSNNARKFQADVYARLAAYVDTYESNESLLTKEEYESLAEEALGNIQY